MIRGRGQEQRRETDMLKISVIEDEAGSAERLQEFLKRYAASRQLSVSVCVYRDAMDFLEEYPGDGDVVFMDIDLPYMNGMDAAARLRRIDEDVCLIFVTNLAQYAIRGYQVQAMDYIVKPVQYGQFELAMNRALRSLPHREDPVILLQTREGKRRIHIRDISWIEVQGHDLIFHAGGRTETIRSTIREAEEEFAPYHFARAGNSYLVNLAFVEQVDGSDVVVGGERIPISRGRRKEFLNAVTDYLGVFGGQR